MTFSVKINSSSARDFFFIIAEKKDLSENQVGANSSINQQSNKDFFTYYRYRCQFSPIAIFMYINFSDVSIVIVKREYVHMCE